MEQEKLAEILKEHKKWLEDKYRGACADLRGAALSGADLSDADLYGANLGGADLSGADLRYADLRRADLRYAYLRDADLSGADLRYAYLRDADLSGADLRYADLSGAEVYAFTLGRDFGFAHFGSQYEKGSYVKIGCVDGGIEAVIDQCKSKGKEAGYTEIEIELYKRQLELILDIENKKSEVN